MAKKVPRRPKHPAMPASTATRAKEHSDAGPRESPQQPVAGKQPLFPIVSVGASAGGLEASTTVLQHLPDDSGMAFVLIQHLDPKQHSQLSDLLSKATRVPILEVDADTPVEPNHVYDMAPDKRIDGALVVTSDIDEIKHARDYAEAIVETVRHPLVVLTDDLKVKSANQAFYETFRVSKSETEGRLIYDLGSGQWNIPKLREALEGVLPKGGSFQDFEVSHTFDGIGRKTMLLSARQLKQLPSYGQEKILLAIEDITARKEAEEARHDNEERYRTLFDLGPVAVYSCDASGVIREFNLRAAELWGRAPKPGDTDERFCGSHKMRLPDGTVMPHNECPMAEVLSGKIPEARDMEVQIERPDSSRITVLVNIRALKNERGEITGAINCFADITAVKAVEDALRNSEEGLRRANDDLQHFAYAASHDLQEPLRMVTSYTQLLAREYKGKLAKDADQFIAYAVEGAHRMDALLKGMRDYWQANEPGKEHHVAIDCNDVLKKTLLNLQETVSNSGASVTHGSLPIVQAEEVMLVQLFQNLIGNAIKYRSKKPPRVHVSAEKNGKKEWLFSVKDNGIGIDPLYAEKIFAMFNRLNGNKHPGSGIGLAICRKVVGRLGGRIWVESKPGGGADFKFTLPWGE
jgi:PAS domain S-box-containing protein